MISNKKNILNLLITLKPLLDLTIVITGVTVAFLLSNWSNQKNERAERAKILSSLRGELVEMQKFFPGMATYQAKMSKTWDSLHNLGLYSDFHHYYYLQPQHNYTVIEYAINTRNSEIVNFRLHEQLLLLYKYIKMLEESEVYMTQIALQYRPDDGNRQLREANLFLFHRFIGFSKNRTNFILAANEVAVDIKTIIDDESVE
jgi:hypothetical protein